jgi:hypothetical protein
MEQPELALLSPTARAAGAGAGESEFVDDPWLSATCASTSRVVERFGHLLLEHPCGAMICMVSTNSVVNRLGPTSSHSSSPSAA